MNRPAGELLGVLAARKTREAEAAHIACLRTSFTDTNAHAWLGIGNEWTRRHFDGDFNQTALPPQRSALSLVFVQSSDGNTAARDPEDLGADSTDKHLIYEGLSRVAAEAVLAGAGTLYRDAFFSVWHPRLIELRQSLGLPRHPAQIVISRSGQIRFDAVLFNAPDVPVFLIAGEAAVSRCKSELTARPWIQIVPLAADLAAPFDRLRASGIRRISVVGGRRTATHLVDAGLVQDLYLTTTSRKGGEAGTPWYDGTRPPRMTIVRRKEWNPGHAPMIFEHFLLQTAG